MIQVLVNRLDRYLDFLYGYLILKARIFRLRLNEEYFNLDYQTKWESYLEKANFEELIDVACRYIKGDVDGRILDIADVMDRASYFALIHPDHPNITLGFLKDADLWNLWLESGIYRYAREAISETCKIGKGDKVVDFGCGSASPSFYSELLGEYGLYVGIDYSRPLLKIAMSSCKEKNLTDRVKLVQGLAESKMEFGKRYDLAILSSILEYSNTRAVLKNVINALNGEGTIIVFSELFRDVQPERERLFELYYSLIPNFKKFPAVNEIQDFLDSSGHLYKIKMYGSHLLRIDVIE